jgi:hypothetical protein
MTREIEKALTPEEEVLLTQKGTVRKRKPKQKIYYFTPDTEAAIMEYVASTDQEERNKIYNSRIEHAFFKLTENIIHTFKFYYTEVDTIQELQHEVTCFLLEKLHKYDQAKGKAYSYFGTIAKRYLIIYNNNNYKKLKSKATLEDVDTDKSILTDMTSASNEETQISKFLTRYVEYVDTNLFELFPKDKELKVADAILELFRNRASLDILSKKSIYIYIREITDAPTPIVTKVIKKLKDIYKARLSKYIDNGEYELDF